MFLPRKKEAIISGVSLGTVGLQVAGVAAFTVLWLTNGLPTLDIKHIVLYKSPEFEFFIDFYFDKTTAVFACVGAVLTFLVAVFSRYYMHREEGFKRYFCTLLLFYAGYNLIIFSGNFETLFMGWEILGITSFLLIAFFRDRYLPVKNGFKVLSFYRLGDICLILAMWMSHHLWHRNITFAEWDQIAAVQDQFQHHYPAAIFIAFMILIAAIIKSAQLPFSTWLPRAMEGPTSSSAIFYGSLSVHIGVFLLLRTYPFWGEEWIIKGIILATGLITSIVATGIARVQSSVKTQIAYSSIAQIGLMFIEIALGLHLLVLIHFAGNAFLRTYQLLVSPSVLNYLIHDMMFHFRPNRSNESSPRLQKIKHALYVLGIKEFNFDFLLHRYFWSPFKWIGNRLAFFNTRFGLVFWVVALVLGGGLFAFRGHIGADLYGVMPFLFILLSVFLVLKGFSERGDARRAWLMAFSSQFLTAIAILLNKNIEWLEVALYLGGSMSAAIVGYLCLHKIKSIEGDVSLSQYHGHIYEQRGLGLVFLLSCLGLAGFPITPTFIGIDLMFTHVHKVQIGMALLMGLNFLFLELALLRIYARIFLGQHKKAYHPIAFRSS